jgi:hypothetical protein
MSIQSSLLRDPRVPKNLVGLQSLAIKIDTSEVSIPGISAHKIKKRTKELVEEEGLTVDNKSSSRLVVSIATEQRESQSVIVYAVQIELRENVALSRNGDATVTGDADTWRHQSTTGVAFAPFNLELMASGLIQEALRQVENFVGDWVEGNTSKVDPKTDDQEETPATEEPTDERMKKIKQKLEELMKGLGIGDDCVSSIEKFDVIGTEVSFEVTVTHRKKNPLAPLGGKYLYSIETTAKGNFDIASPASLKDAKVCTKLPPALGSQEVCVPLKDLASIV